MIKNVNNKKLRRTKLFAMVLLSKHAERLIVSLLRNVLSASVIGLFWHKWDLWPNYLYISKQFNKEKDENKKTTVNRPGKDYVFWYFYTYPSLWQKELNCRVMIFQNLKFNSIFSSFSFFNLYLALLLHLYTLSKDSSM